MRESSLSCIYQYMQNVLERFHTLDRRSGVPLYAQVSEMVRLLVEDGTFHTGDLIPSENEISRYTGISRMTVRRGLQDLVREGILEAVSGKGYSATARRIHLAGGVLRSFTRELEGMGLRPHSRVLECRMIRDDPVVHVIFGKPAQMPLLRIRRLRSGNDEPLAVETAWFDPVLVPGLEQEDLSASIYATIREKCGIVLRRAEQTIQACSVDPEQAELLGVDPGSAVLKIRRTTRDRMGRIIEFVESVIRSDRYVITMELQ